jgi:hypothetical protein
MVRRVRARELTDRVPVIDIEAHGQDIEGDQTKDKGKNDRQFHNALLPAEVSRLVSDRRIRAARLGRAAEALPPPRQPDQQGCCGWGLHGWPPVARGERLEGVSLRDVPIPRTLEVAQDDER